MSLAHIDSLTWHRLFTRAFRGYLSQGIDPADARRRAARELNKAFRLDTGLDAVAHQKDHDEDREGLYR